MKKIYLITFVVLFFLTGCDEAVLSELKTRNEELRIENVSLKAQVNEIERNLTECNKKFKEAGDEAIKKLYQHTPQSNPNNNPIR